MFYVSLRVTVRTTFASTTTVKMGLKDFPNELLAKIFLHLSYKSLLYVLAVSVQWNAVVTADPALSVQMFRKPSRVYVEPGSRNPNFRRDFHYDNTDTAEPIRLHPAVQMTSYVMGSDISEVDFMFGPQLVDLEIADDLISIPTVTMATIQVPERRGRNIGFKIKVKNSKGVRLIDLFRGIAEESSREVCVDGYEYGSEIALRKLFGETITRTTLLGDHRHYEGLYGVVRKGLGLSADIFLGS
ncbi:RBR-type E3 ubiquitin transferase [Mycena venus]|uniref:RBR-type E3 ubiquitin transferase n=1 Tax=Mycena venus TaxID=2733690 RepID=A0A8H7CIU5_9AGAR|nr:RBR-type E3 ubiquitin transferase [Mycena venus]